MDSFINLVMHSGLSVASYGMSYGLYKNDMSFKNKFSRCSLISGFALMAMGASAASVKYAGRFLKAG